MASKEYLAAKYMSGPRAQAILAKASGSSASKKKKSLKGQLQSSSTLLLRDDDAEWSASAEVIDDDNEAVARGEVIVASDRSFKKRTAGNWETIRDVTPAVDEQPVLVALDEIPSRLSGGIVSKSQLSRIRGGPVRKDEHELPPEETVYRDESGRQIDTKAERAAAARERRIREEKDAQKMEWGKGIVQRGEQERLQQELEKEKLRDVARHADDPSLNEAQKQQARWNDPAAAFLTKSQTKGSRKPEYSGPPPPPNRYAIRPGYRWDGVDRGNGFEKSLFQRGNERQRKGLEAYEWSVDDM